MDVESALNAVFGDYLERRGNSLAIEMAFYHRGAPLALSSQALAAHPGMSPRIVLLVHGMAETEACWQFPDDPARSYGTLLCDELGMTPLYVRYNTGRHVSHNGRDLAALIERLVESSPVPVEDITLIGHSMGGLVIRSACHYAAELGLSWMCRAKRAIYLGSPHLGAPLEKAGHLVSLALGAFDHPVVRLTRTLANLRSSGVKDMRHGSLLDEEWVGDDLTPLRDAERIPLCAGVDHYLIAGTLTERENDFVTHLFGDALVRVPSATDPGRRAGLPEHHFAVLAGIHHRELAHRPEVYAKIRAWLGATSVEAPASLADVVPSPVPQASRALERIDAYRALMQDAVEHGTAAVQEVQEELTARPYDWIERAVPLEAPVKVVRATHFAAIRGAYGMTRFVNRLVGAALHEGIEWIKRG